MFALENVCYSYGKTPALRGLSLSIKEGEFVGVIGPNSSGKSTLLRVLAGVRCPQQGSANLQNRALNAWPLLDLARQLTVVASEHFFAFPFTVEQVVLMGRTPFLRRAQWESAADRELAKIAMREADVWNLRDRAVHHLSSGERQRVLLARALAQEPRILLLDEPAAHLDISHQWQLFQLLQKLHQERNLTVVCAMHDLTMAARYCQRLIVLREGQIVADGAPRDVLVPQIFESVFGLTVHMQWLSSGEPGLFVLNNV